MRANFVRKVPRLSLAFSATLILVASLLAPATSQALSTFREIEATKWGYTFAGQPSSAPSSRPKSANLEAKSKFIINFKNFPEWAKRDFQAAVDVWAANFTSSVAITIDATWARSSSYAVLGSARPGNYFAGFDGAPDASLWYPSALANALAGKDLDTNNSEIVIQVNSVANWNPRNDGSPRSTEYDLESVFIHEMGHGLGFLSTDSYDPFFAYGSIEQPTAFDAYLQTEDGRRLSDLPSPSLELGKALTSPLVWTGPLGVAANGGVKPLMYTPKKYEDGSSVSHLDENTFSNTGPNSVMTPNLDAGEIFHEPGSLLLAMMEDLRRKPPVGLAVGIPQPVRNASALISDGGAIIAFDPPANARSAQISTYSVKNLKTNQVISSAFSPIEFTGLKNGTSYAFSITASNTNGISEAVVTAPITPQAGWKQVVVDEKSDAKHVTSAIFNGQPVIAYSDGKTGVLKIATWNGSKWLKTTVDGAGGSQGRTRSAINSPISLCVNGSGKKQSLHIFYSDLQDHDLRYATYDGKNLTYEIVDGNGAQVNDYKDPIRVRTGSDVSVSNACVATAGGIQVYYRDESQGILLGAIKLKGATKWSYELVDGDRKTDGRSTGDVAFHLKALFDGDTTYLIYDSTLTINQRKEATSGEIRVATRKTLSADSWSYQNLDISGSLSAMVGYDVAIVKTLKGISAAWLTATAASAPNPNKIRWGVISANPSLTISEPENFGRPGKYLAVNGRTIAYNCQLRLCALDTVKNTASLVSKEQSSAGIESTWVVIAGVNYLVAGINRQLTLLRP